MLYLANRTIYFHDQKYLYGSISLVIWVPIGGLLSYLINLHTDLGVVISAAAVGLTASFIPNLNNNSTYLKDLPSAIYCGSFVGMSSIELAPPIQFILYSSLAAAFILIVGKSTFHGIGGRLGTMAFFGVSVTSFIIWILE